MLLCFFKLFEYFYCPCNILYSLFLFSNNVTKAMHDLSYVNDCTSSCF